MEAVVRNGIALALLASLGASCGTQGDASALPDRWPRAGLDGYTFFNADDPTLLAQPGVDLDEPAALPDGAGGLLIFGRMTPTDTSQPSQIFEASVPTLDQPGSPRAALAPSLPWEGGKLRGPSVPDASMPFVCYQGEDGSVGLAELAGDTLKKVSLTAPIASAADLGGGKPVGRAACVHDHNAVSDRFRIYYTVDDSAIYVAEADAAPVFAPNAPIAWQVRPIGLSASRFNVPPGDTKAVPAEHISELSARYTVTPADRGRWDLSIVASAGSKQSLVVASAYASPAGSAAESYFAGSVPLITTTDGALQSPALCTYRQQPLLLVGLQMVRSVIAAAVLP